MKVLTSGRENHLHIFQMMPAVLFAAYVLVGAWKVPAASGSDSTKHWVATWGTAPYNTQSSNQPPTSFDNYTVRQIVRASIGGDTVRVKFSNITCSQPVIIRLANIAISLDSSKSPVDPATITALKFGGNDGVTINAKSEVYSDPVAFNLAPGKRLAITTYFGQCKSTADMTFHYGSRTDSYYISGDKTSSADFAGSSKVEAWYTLYNVEVLVPKSAATVVATGNSITDGYGLHGGQFKWTDWFSAKLLANDATKEVGVVNVGIGATLVTGASNGAQSGVDRNKHDVLDQSGVRWVIVFYGVNDINGGRSAGNITDGFKKMIAECHAKDTGIKVYGATITPFNGHSYYSAAHESVRKQVNEWIRADNNFDGCIDFDEAIRNPNDASRLQQAYSNDWLHPSAEGHKVMGQSIDLKLFTPPVENKRKTSGRRAKALSVTLVNNNTTVAFNLPHESFVSLKLYSVLGKEIAELAGRNFSSGRHTMGFDDKNYPHGICIYSIKAGGFSASWKTVMPVR